MKIDKKIFVLSTSAILGVSFCTGTAFASGISKKGSKISVKHTVSKPYPYNKLRRTSEMNAHYGIGISDAIRKSSKSVPLKFEDDVFKNLKEEEARPVDMFLLMFDLNYYEKLMI